MTSVFVRVPGRFRNPQSHSGRKVRGGPCGHQSNGKTSAFQAEDEGSIPSARFRTLGFGANRSNQSSLKYSMAEWYTHRHMTSGFGGSSPS